MNLPEPLTPAECDLRGLEYMPLLGAHLFGSEFNAKATDLEFRVAVTLWWAAWTQHPAASLPDDDAALCKFADLGRDLKTWRKIRACALHGFVKCSDGRLYHGTLAKQANIAWEKRVKDRERKAAWRAQKEAGRAEQQGHVTHDVPDMSRGTERGRDAENALNRRDGTGRDENKPKPTITPQIEKPKPTRATDCFNEVCSAADWHPRTDDQRAEALGIVNGWLAEGFSIDVILAGIGLARSRKPSERTRTIKRFTTTIRGMHCDRQGQRMNGSSDPIVEHQTRQLVGSLGASLRVGQ